MEKPRVEIACQGGDSQTAFTAGALKALFENKVQDHFNIVSFSGTSGGAICAFLIWYALKKGDAVVWKRLIDFWQDNAAQTPQERLFNDSAIQTMRLISQGMIPSYNVSPSNPQLKTLMSFATQGMRSRFTDFKELLETHIDFSEVAAWGVQPEPPFVILGACNILTGRLRKFVSRLEPMRIERPSSPDADNLGNSTNQLSAFRCKGFMGRREGKQSRRRLCIGRQHSCLLTYRSLLTAFHRNG